MNMKTTIYLELALNCSFDYSPPEPMVMYPNDHAYPGCDAAVDVTAIDMIISKKRAGEIIEDLTKQVNSGAVYCNLNLVDALADSLVEDAESQCWAYMDSLDEHC